MKFIVGTRGSPLALCQTRQIISYLKNIFPELNFEIKIIKTSGDKFTSKPLFQLVNDPQGTKGLFVKEIEDALLNKKIDFAVHSLKDLPGELAPGLCLTALSKRLFPYDVVIPKDSKIKSIFDLPQNALIGTSSLRRRVQLQIIRSDLKFSDLRGNLDTRIKKLHSQNLDAIVVAEIGLKRLNIKINYFRLPIKLCLPAVGQGVLAIESRKDNKKLSKILTLINDKATSRLITAERSFLKEFGGGCQIPIAGYAQQIDNENFKIWGMIFDEKQKKVIKSSLTGKIEKAKEMGKKLGKQMKKLKAYSL